MYKLQVVEVKGMMCKLVQIKVPPKRFSQDLASRPPVALQVADGAPKATCGRPRFTGGNGRLMDFCWELVTTNF